MFFLTDARSCRPELTLIAMRKSIHGSPLLFCMGTGLRLTMKYLQIAETKQFH